MPVRELQIFRRHGRQFVPDLRKAALPAIFRGRPLISAEITGEEAIQGASLCPAGAFQTHKRASATSATPDETILTQPSEKRGNREHSSFSCTIDLGMCLFCCECEFALPGKVRFTNDHRLATNRRQDLLVRMGEDKPVKPDPERIRKEIRSFFRHALKLRQVSAGGDNSAEMELNAAGNVNFDMGRYGIEFVASPRHADGIVVTGPISENMAEALQICYDAIPAPKLVILAGTDAISGGIFRDSPALNRRFLTKYEVDLYVPGNPPHPLTFINGILDLIGKK